MNRERAKELLPVIQAFADGEEIQLKGAYGWVTLKDPLWNFKPTKYRIKPKLREFTLEMNTDGTVRNILEAGEAPWFDGTIHIKVREVEEGKA